jgi:hypothetical protein
LLSVVAQSPLSPLAKALPEVDRHESLEKM